MDANTIIKKLQEKADGMEMAAEVERAVVKGMEPYYALLELDRKKATGMTIRGARNYADALSNERRYLEDARFYRAVIDLIRESFSCSIRN